MPTDNHSPATDPAARPARRADGGGDPRVGGPIAARKFIGRAAQLDLDTLRDAVETWRRTMRDQGAAWFAAEETVGAAVVAAGLRGEQRQLLADVADAFRELVWYGSGGGHTRAAVTAEVRVHATEGSGQYLGVVAMLAVLVRDRLSEETFELLYRPFAAAIPPAELAPE
jgi:hypothetical protein